MKYFTLFGVLILTVLFGNGLDCVKVKHKIKKPIDFAEIRRTHISKIKIVHYAFKKNDEIKIKSMPVKVLSIAEPFHDWIAKSIWTGDNYNITGWSFLEIETNQNASDVDQAFAVGYLEGQLTKELINLHLINTVGDFCSDQSPTCQKLIPFLVSNFKWINNQINQHPNDPYWYQVNLLLTQFNGLFHGYYNKSHGLNIKNSNALESMINDIKPYLNLLALQMNGDMSEVIAAINKVSDPFIAGSCSALIKVLKDNTDLYVSHDTWGPYEVMLKILKHIKLNYRLTHNDPVSIPGSEVSFSSYPGILSSIDDFTIINSKLVVTETTIGNANANLWKFVTPETNLYWIRNIVANRLSFTGPDWAKWFSMYNSGTYNNEWMIIDYKQFYPREPLRDNLLVVLEQLPGQVMWQDKTDVLREETYWSSYNIAYYPEIYNISGTYDSFVQYGDFFSYAESPRANIFRRDNHNIVDVDSMIRMMRYNNYTQDPFSRCECDPPYSGENTISARSDLNPSSGKYPFDALGHRDHGATDMKMTSWEMVRDMQMIAISGPTYDEENDVPPFVWSESDFGDSTSHVGLPDKAQFEPILVKWNL